MPTMTEKYLDNVDPAIRDEVQTLVKKCVQEANLKGSITKQTVIQIIESLVS